MFMPKMNWKEELINAAKISLTLFVIILINLVTLFSIHSFLCTVLGHHK